MVRGYAGCVRLGLGSDLKTCSGKFGLLSGLPVINFAVGPGYGPGLRFSLEWRHGGRLGFALSPPTLPQRTRKGWGTHVLRDFRLPSEWVGHLPRPTYRE